MRVATGCGHVSLMMLQHGIKPTSSWQDQHKRCMLQEKLLSGVDRDLAPFKDSGITLEMVEQVYCTYNVQSFRVQVGPRRCSSV